jgi:hypothetical protein
VDSIVDDQGNVLMLELQGFDNDSSYVWERNDAELRRIEPDRACWPLLLETRFRLQKDLDLRSWYAFHESLRAHALRDTRADSSALVELTIRHRFMLLLPTPHIQVLANQWGIMPREAFDRRQPYPHRDLFVYSRDLGLVFANSAVYTGLISEVFFNQTLKSGGTDSVLLQGLKQLPEDQRAMGDMAFTAHINTLLHKLRHGDRSLSLTERVHIMQDVEEVIEDLLGKHYRRSLMQLCYLLPYTGGTVE